MNIVATLFVVLGILGFSLSCLYLLIDLFWGVYGLLCVLCGGISNELLSSLSYNYVFDAIDDIRPRVNSYHVLDGQITKNEQIDIVISVLDKLKKESKAIHNFRQQHFDRSWINYVRRDVKKAKDALKYMAKSK